MTSSVELSIIAIDSASNIIENIGNKFGVLGELAVAGLGIATEAATFLVSALGDLVNEAGSAQYNEELFNATVENSPLAKYKDQLMAVADAKYKVTMYSKDEIIAADQVLAKYGNLGDKVVDVSKLTLDFATMQKIDAVSAAQQLGKALEDIAGGSLGLLARTRLLTAEQKDSAVAMAKAGDVAGAQTFIIDALDKKVGGLAERMGNTYQGKVKIFQDTLEELRETLGGPLLTALQPLMDQFEKLAIQYTPMIVDAFNKYIVPAFNGFINLVSGVVDAFDTVAPQVGILQGILAGLSNVFYGLGLNAIGGFIIQISDMVDAFQRGAGNIKNFDDVLSGLIVAFGGLGSAGETIAYVLSGVEDVIQNGLMPFLDLMALWWQANGPSITASAYQMFDTITTLVQNLTDKIVPFIKEQLASFAKWFVDNGPTIDTAIQNIATFFKDVLAPAVIDAWDLIQPILKLLTDVVGGLASIVLDVLAGNWSKAWTDMKSTVENLVPDILATLGPLVKVIEFLYSISPSALGTKLGQLISGGVPASAGTFHNYGGSITPKASGGWASGLTQINEEGPEIVNLPNGSYVNSASQSAKMMGGSFTFVYSPMFSMGNKQEAENVMAPIVANVVRRMQVDGRV